MGHRRPGAFSLENNHFYDLINVNNTLKFALQPCTPKPCKHVIHDYSALCAQLKLFSKSDLSRNIHCDLKMCSSTFSILQQMSTIKSLPALTSLNLLKSSKVKQNFSLHQKLTDLGEQLLSITSETRFGEISPFWQNLQSLG